MKASVILPVFNKAAYLGECLASIRAQDLEGLEIIAVDDCSTDDSLRILEGVDDRRLRIVRTERNLGPSGAMQRGIDAAAGEYLIRVDADDVCLPGRFTQQVAFMEAHPEIGVSGGAIRLLHRPDAIRTKPLAHDDCRAQLLFGVAVHQPTAIFRRDALLRSGVRFADELPRRGEDWLVQLRLSDRMRMANIAAPLVLYRMGPHNSGAGRNRADDIAFLTREAFAHFGIALADEDLAHVLIAHKHFDQPLAPAGIKRFRAWLERLEQAAMATGRFEPSALRARMRQAWDELCFHMPNHGMRAVLCYLAHDDRPSLRKARYLASSMITGKRYVNDDPS